MGKLERTSGPAARRRTSAAAGTGRTAGTGPLGSRQARGRYLAGPPLLALLLGGLVFVVEVVFLVVGFYLVFEVLVHFQRVRQV